MRAILVERWPRCFKPIGETPLPLKVHIHRDILAAAPDLDTNDISNALTLYVSDPAYHTAIMAAAADSPRFDLDGNAAGTVKIRAIKYSAKMLKRCRHEAARAHTPYTARHHHPLPQWRVSAQDNQP
jgi:sRNA-binding protein